MRLISVTYTGALDDHIDLKIKEVAGQPAKHVGSSYEVASRKRNLQFKVAGANAAYEVAQRLKLLVPFMLDVYVM